MNEEKQDSMLYDGEQQRYLRLLANGGEEEMGVDASDVDSSDVASSDDDIQTDGESDEESDQGELLSSLKAKRESRVAIKSRGARAEGASRRVERNPLLAEITSKAERRQAATQRWFSDPLFDEVDQSLGGEGDRGIGDGEPAGGEETEKDGSEGEANRRRPSKRSRHTADETKDIESESATGKGGESQDGAAANFLASMPKTDKEKRKEKRKKVREWGVVCRWQYAECSNLQHGMRSLASCCRFIVFVWR